MGMLLSSPAGNDLPFDEDLCLQGRNFSNKIWNALRLIDGWEVDESIEAGDAEKWAMNWFGEVLSRTLEDLNSDFEKYRLSEALMRIYKLIWNDFCSWYLELVKPAYGEPIAKDVFDQTKYFFDSIMKILHPFMPFITEEVWHLLSPKPDNKFINNEDWPNARVNSRVYLEQFTHVEELITALRTFRKEKNIAFKQGLDLRIKNDLPEGIAAVKKLTNVASISSEWLDTGSPILAGAREYQIILDDSIADISDEEKLNIEKEVSYLLGFIASIEKKLSNPNFVNNAPSQVVDLENKKIGDAQSKLKVLKSRLD